MNNVQTDLWAPRTAPHWEAMESAIQALYANALPAASSALPKLTIVTPSFNQARFLERTLLSVLHQGYPNLDYRVIDGGSRDGSVDIIRRYAHRLSYWASEPDRGQAHAVNKGLAKATGEWVAFQNSDDIYLPGALQAIGEAITRNPQASVITGHIAHLDGADRLVDVQLVDAAPTLSAQLTVGIQYHNQATFWRRSLLEDLGGLQEDLRFCLDFELFTRQLAKGYRPHVVQRYIGGFRAHADAKSSTLLEVARHEHAKIVERYATRPLSAARAQRIWSRLRKAARFVLSGQGWYLLRRRRMRAMRSTDART